jgi:thiol:disulfide interchange protein DsbC
LSTREDLSETRRKAIRLDLVNAFDDDSIIVFESRKPKHTITVFTDIDCGYCRKLHNEIDQYNGKGITVRYLLFPRTGVNSPSYDKAVTVWCSEDRKKAITLAKAGRNLPLIKCDNTVAEQMEAGNLAGVNATPTIILSDGEVVRGYLSADKLAAVLGARP